MKKYERVKALVSLDAIAHNFEEMHRNVKEGTRIIAVIKADGYGHGARAIADTILKLKGQITIIAIAHRLSTLAECDYKIEFAEGKAAVLR